MVRRGEPVWKRKGALAAFGLVNALALYLGGRFTGPGVQSAWYQGLDQAPWTPPGWVFGLAWTLVMVGLTVFMARAVRTRELLAVFALQWALNIAWNPVFFAWRAPWAALVVIVALAGTVIGLARMERRRTIWLAPYLIWLAVATSLNAWIAAFN